MQLYDEFWSLKVWIKAVLPAFGAVFVALG